MLKYFSTQTPNLVVAIVLLTLGVITQEPMLVLGLLLLRFDGEGSPLSFLSAEGQEDEGTSYGKFIDTDELDE